MRFPRSLSLAFLGATLPAVAQTHFCIGGDLDHLSAREVSQCQAKMSHVRETVRRRGAPDGWHFVVVCDETGWGDVAAFSGQTRAALRSVDFSTDQEMHWTFLRGSRFSGGDGDSTGTVVAAALRNVPGGRIENGPVPMPNPRRTVQQPALQMADAHEAQPSDDLVGQ